MSDVGKIVGVSAHSCRVCGSAVELGSPLDRAASRWSEWSENTDGAVTGSDDTPYKDWIADILSQVPQVVSARSGSVCRVGGRSPTVLGGMAGVRAGGTCDEPEKN